MWSIHFIAAVVLLLLLMQWSHARNLNVAAGIANKQLTIEESSGNSVQSTTLSNDANSCSICLEHIHRVESASPNYPMSNESFPCGHGINIHERCFGEYLESPSSKVECPLCRGLLKLTLKHQKILRAWGPYLTPALLSRFPVHMKELLEKWPRIQEIGHAKMYCLGMPSVFIIRCASVVLTKYAPNTVSLMLTQYIEDPKQFVELQMWNFSQLLHRVKNFRVYNDAHGNVITIHEAYRHSIKYQNGEHYRRNLQHISTLISNLSEGDISQQLLRFPELINFGYAMLQDNGNFIGSIKQALSLLCVRSPSLNTAMLETTLEEVNYEFFVNKDSVDHFLDTKFPYLLEFKSMGDFEFPQDTIENNARLIMHPAFIHEHELNILSELNAGAKSVNHSASEYIKQKYDHCKIIHFKMENSPGRDITLYTAIKFSLNPNLGMGEKRGWNTAIKNEVLLYGCTPKDIPPFRSMRYRFSKLYKRTGKLKQRISNLSIRGTD